MFAFPDQARTTAVDHVMLNWNPQGHDPVVLFGKPHFDFHFDMSDMATIQAINPADPNYTAKAERVPEARYVPQDYAIPPGPPMAAKAVSGMGVHWADSSDTTLVPGRLQTDRHQRHLGRPLHLYRANDHPRMVVDQTSLPTGTQSHLTRRPDNAHSIVGPIRVRVDSSRNRVLEPLRCASLDAWATNPITAFRGTSRGCVAPSRGAFCGDGRSRGP